ncbi:ribonuclease H-like protein [Nemania sp. NC0429]|nr:ribonuclease H-like protein [Nemania sp. NC0429]
MPLGWYLGQGLIPLLPDSSDDDEGPCELPDGRIVCGPHGLVVCGKCCVDYSFMDDGEDEDDDEHMDAETERLYSMLSPERRAAIDSRWGPPPGASNRVSSLNSDAHSPPQGPSTFDMSDDDLDDSPGPKKRRGTGRVFPVRFTPPSSTITPAQLFPGREVFPGRTTYGHLTRYIHRDDDRKVLFFTDGACLNNGQPNPKGGWAFVHGPGFGFGDQSAHTAAGRLEKEGPFGDSGIQSSNRAELRAVIAALRFRHWTGEGFNTVVIATDSEYVTTGSTEWAKTWIENGWKTAGGTDVKNKDLWEMLLGEVEKWKDEGLLINFWRIPRDWNKVADAAAKKAAEKDEAPDRWMDMFGI